MTDQVNEAVAKLTERRQWVRHAAEISARANEDAAVRELRKEEDALNLAIESLQATHPSRGVVDEVIATLDQIGGLTRALRQGGPAPEDLQELSDALTEATNMAHEALHALQAAQPAVPSVPEGELRVTVFHQSGDEPFIVAVHGKATVHDLASIEADLRGEDGDLLSRGDGDYLLSARYFSGQHDEMGRCEFPAGWELHVESFAATTKDQPAQGVG